MASDSKTTVQSRLRVLASQVGGSSALAGLLGIHRGTLYDYLSGVREVPKARLEKIAAMYPCDLQWLLTGAGKPPQPSAARTQEAKAAAKGTSSGVGVGRHLRPEGAEPGRRPDLHPSLVEKGRQVRLEAARERVLELIKMYQADEIKKVLGPALYDEVLAGRACPSLALLADLAAVLGVKPGWVQGLEE